MKRDEESRIALAYDRMQKAMAYEQLADEGRDPEANRARAIALYEQARGGLPRGSVDYAACLVNEANVRLGRAEHTGAARELHRAIALYRQARPRFSAYPEYQRICLLGEGNAWTTLAELGELPGPNLKKAIARFAAARGGDEPIDLGDARSLINEAVARIALADRGTQPEQHLALAVGMLERARAVLDESDPETARARINEGNARCALADLNRDAIENLRRALALYEQARASLPQTHPEFALCLMNEGAARTQLAALGEESQENWERAAALFETAHALFPPRSLNRGRCLLNEGAARRNLADLGIHFEENLTRAVALYRAARKLFPPDSLSHARSLMSEATTRLSLAEWGFAPRPNLRQAAELYRKAAAALPRGSLSWARCKLSECNARTHLSEVSRKPEEALREAIALAREAKRSLKGDPLNIAACETNEALAWYTLAEATGETASLRRAADLSKRAAGVLAGAGIGHEAMSAYQILGTVESARGRWAEAHAAFLKAIKQAEGLRHETQPHQRQNVQARTLEIFQAAIEISLRNEAYGDALDEVERLRSRNLADLLEDRDRPPRKVSRATWDEWRGLGARLAEIDAALRASLITERPAAAERDERGPAARKPLLAERQAVEFRLRALKTHIRTRDPEYDFAAETLSFDQMQDTVNRLGRAVVSFHLSELGAAMFVLAPRSRPMCIRTRSFTEGRLRELVFGNEGWLSGYERYRRAAAAGHPEAEALRARWEAGMPSILQALHDEWLRPVREELMERGESRAVFVAGGLAGILPLHAAAWRDEAGELRYLIEEMEIGYAPSIAILRRCLERRRPPVARATIASAAGGEAARIGYASWEANRIAALLRSRPNAPEVCLLGEPSYVAKGLCDAAADATTLLAALPDQGLCHLACHGAWDAASPLDSWLSLAGGEPLSLRRLFAEGRMDHAQFIALSACESSLGLDSGAPIEEYRGLPAGLLHAGARCVVGSLWVVSDFPAALLMTRLYHELLAGDGEDVSRALQRTQQWAIRSSGEDKRTFLRQLNQIEPRLSEDNQRKLEAALLHCETLFRQPATWAAFQSIGVPARSPFLGRRPR